MYRRRWTRKRPLYRAPGLTDQPRCIHTWVHAKRERWLKGCQGYSGSETSAEVMNDHNCTPLFPWAINMDGALGTTGANVAPFNGWNELSTACANAFNQYVDDFDQFKVVAVRWTVHFKGLRNTNAGGLGLAAVAGTDFTMNYSEQVKFLTVRDYDAWPTLWMYADPTAGSGNPVGAEEWQERWLRNNLKGLTRYGKQASGRPKAIREAASEYQGIAADGATTSWLNVDNSRPTYGWFNCQQAPGAEHSPAKILFYCPQIFSTPFLMAMAGQPNNQVANLGSIKIIMTASVCLAFRGRQHANYQAKDQFDWI